MTIDDRASAGPLLLPPNDEPLGQSDGRILLPGVALQHHQALGDLVAAVAPRVAELGRVVTPAKPPAAASKPTQPKKTVAESFYEQELAEMHRQAALEARREHLKSLDYADRQGELRPWEDRTHPSNRAHVAATQAARAPKVKHSAEAAYSGEIRAIVREVVKETKHALINEVPETLGTMLRAHETAAPGAQRQRR